MLDEKAILKEFEKQQIMVEDRYKKSIKRKELASKFNTSEDNIEWLEILAKSRKEDMLFLIFLFGTTAVVFVVFVYSAWNGN